MKILRTMGILALVAGLVLGGAGSVFAKGPPDDPPGGGPHSPKHGLFGTVTSVETITEDEEYVIDLDTKLGDVKLTINGDANYMVPKEEPHGPKDLANFVDIVDEDEDGDLEELEGRRLAVLASDLVEQVTPPPDFTATAIRLMLIPSVPLHAHRVGVVEAFTADTSITIIDRHGVSHSFDVNGDTDYRPEGTTDGDITVGESFVTVVIKGDPKVVLPAKALAKAIVLHDED